MGCSVVFYAPNVIGYVRVILAILAFYHSASPVHFLFFYCTSYLLDALDGYAARVLSQNSEFGKVLDMVTDRSTSAGLLCALCLLYPSGAFVFQLLLALDISSHYMQMYAALSIGATSHKEINRPKGLGGRIMSLYYTSRPVLFGACAGNELFFIALYMMSHASVGGATWWMRGDVWRWCMWGSSPIWAFKQVTNVVQLVTASTILVSLDTKGQKQKRP